MKIGIVGSGQVALALADGFMKHGHSVMLGTRTPKKLEDWDWANKGGLVGTVPEAAQFGEVLVLAVKGTAASEALRAAGATNMAGKVVIDTTNPIDDTPPVNGVLSLFTKPDESLMERLQRECPGARLVKAFNSVGNKLMVNPKFAGGGKPTMFICGNDDDAKKTVTGFLDQFGWETVDMG
jgi:predicted dinucleotide-binding enzyme